jgi:hypothetical protein
MFKKSKTDLCDLKDLRTFRPHHCKHGENLVGFLEKMSISKIKSILEATKRVYIYSPFTFVLSRFLFIFWFFLMDLKIFPLKQRGFSVFTFLDFQEVAFSL